MIIFLPYLNEDEMYQRCVKSLNESLNEEEKKEVEIIMMKDERGIGFVKMYNLGIDIAREKKDDLFIIHTDIEFPKDWYSELKKYYETGDIIGTKLVYADGRIQSAGGMIGGTFNIGNNSYDLGQFDTISYPTYVTFAGVLIKYNVLKEIKGDENYSPQYFDDTDYCLTAKEKGFKVVYVPVKLIHHESQTMRNMNYIEIFQRNANYFFSKWGHILK